MKKFFLMAAAVCAAFTGCIKNESEIQGNEPSNAKIGFSAPVVSTQTRAIIDGTAYPAEEKFVVSGWYTAPSADAPALYMTNAVCSAQDNKVEETTYKSWMPANEYYWPKTGSMYFYAYSPNGIAGAALETTGLKLNYALSADNNETDVLYSNKAVVDDCAAHVNAYKEVNGENGSKYYGVEIQFNHALGAVLFQAKAKEEYANAEIKIKSIVLTSKNSGTFQQSVNAENNDASAWTSDAADSDITLFANAEGTQIGSEQAEKLCAKLVIPQVLSEYASVAVTYSITNTADSNSTYETTANFALNKFVFNDEETAEWKRNRKHIYTITIGLDRIYFAPSVVAWDKDVTADMEI